LKILHILEPSGIGGVEHIVADIYRKLNNKECQIFIAIPKKYRTEFISNFKINNTKNIIEMNFDNTSKFSIKRLIVYKELLKKINPDIIHTHSRKACIFVSLINKKSIHIRTQHMQDRDLVPKFDKFLLSRRVDLWIGTSNNLVHSYIKEQYGDVLAKCIYNGVTIPSEIKSYQNTNQEKKIGFIGRLNKQKGLDIFIPILKQVDLQVKKSYEFIIIGEGEERESLEKLVNKLNLNSKVKFVGTKSEIYKELLNLDFLVLPSRKEGLPLVLLEAMACGVPVIANDVGAINEVIINNKNGFIVNNDDEWLNLLTLLIDEKKSLKNISQHCAEHIKANFSVERMCNEYLRVYKDYGN
jgi:glycosyltransferase involved in cell wall biosynthesis